jgi:hypothetical protein
MWGILIIVLILWLLGAISGFAGGFIHLLLVAALVVLIVNLIRGY